MKTSPAPEIKRCNLKAKNAPSPSPPRSCSGKLTRVRNVSRAVLQISVSIPLADANLPTASSKGTGFLRRSPRPSSSPNSSSAQIESGYSLRVLSSRMSGSGVSMQAANFGKMLSRLSSVARRKDSSITESMPMSVPKRREATLDTASALPSSDPSDAIVADVPMQIGALFGEHRSRNRRTRTATSAPCRPR